MLIPDLDENEYHRHPALSQSGAKLLLPPSCPAMFKFRQENPQHKAVFDFGHAAHAEVLGKGAPIRYIQGRTAKGEPSDGWATKYAQEQRAEAYAAGEIPLLESQRGIIEGMAAALRRHPKASMLLEAGRGRPEVSLFWSDPSGVDLRCRVDWLPNPGSDPFITCDYKTSASADPGTFAASAAKFGYHMQNAHYEDAVRALGLHDAPSFLFIVQERDAPFLVSVVELPEAAVELGRRRMREAIEIYQQCMETDHWPSYADDEIVTVDLPAWAYREAAA